MDGGHFPAPPASKRPRGSSPPPPPPPPPLPPPTGRPASNERLLDVLLQDLRELETVPLFDRELPVELVLLVFRFLSVRDLGHCARVSRAWRFAAEDSVLWHGIAIRLGWDDLAHWTLRHSLNDDDTDGGDDDDGRRRSAQLARADGHRSLLLPDGSPAWKQVCRVRATYDRWMTQNWAELRCTTTVVEGRESFLVVRQSNSRGTTFMPPALTSVAFVRDRIYAGYNDNSLRCWTVAEALIDSHAEPPAISGTDTSALGGAAGVRLQLREQRSLLWPSTSRAGAQAGYVSTVRAAGARVFSAHVVFSPFDLGDDEDDDGDGESNNGDEVGAVSDVGSGRIGARNENASGRGTSTGATAGASSGPVPAVASERDDDDGADGSAPWTGPFVSVWDAFTGYAIAALPLPARALVPPPPPAGVAVAPVPTRTFSQPWPLDSSAVVRTLEPSLDGSRVVATCTTGHLVVWDSAQVGHFELLDTVVAHTDGIAAASSIAVNDRLHVLTGSAGPEGGARLFAIGREAGSTRCLHDLRGCDQVLSLLATPAVLVVAAESSHGSGRSKITVFDTATGLPTIGSLGHADAMASDLYGARSLHLSVDAATLVAGGRDANVRLYDVRSNRCVQTLRGHRGSVASVQHDGIKVVSGSDDATTRLFDVRTGQAMWHTTDTQPVRFVGFTDRVLVTGSYAPLPRPYKARQWFRPNAGKVSVLDFSPAANVSRVHAEYRSTYTAAPERSSYLASLQAPYTDLLGEDG